MKEGVNKGLEDVAELGRELEKAAIKAGYGSTIKPESVEKLVRAISDYQVESLNMIAAPPQGERSKAPGRSAGSSRKARRSTRRPSPSSPSKDRARRRPEKPAGKHNAGLADGASSRPRRTSARKLLSPPIRIGHLRVRPELGERLDIGQDLGEPCGVGPSRVGPRLDQSGQETTVIPACCATWIALRSSVATVQPRHSARARHIASPSERKWRGVMDERGLLLVVVGLARRQQARGDERASGRPARSRATPVCRVVSAGCTWTSA